MLTDIQVKSLKPKEKRYSIADGEGLSIEVFPTGKKKRVLSYRIGFVAQRFEMQSEPYRVCRRPTFLREYPDEKSKIYP